MYQGLKEVDVIATVISEKKETQYKAKYTIQVESINYDVKYNDTNLIMYVEKTKELKYGDKISIQGTFEFANQAKNYKLFDYREYLKIKNTYGILNASKVNILKKENLNVLSICVNKIRERIKENLKIILGKESAVAIGILIRGYFWYR